MTNTTKNTSAILRFGKRGTRTTAMWAGKVLGAVAGQGGTLSAVRWRPRFWAMRSTFIVAAWTTFSPTTKQRLPKAKASSFGKVRHEFGPGLKQKIENQAGDFI